MTDVEKCVACGRPVPEGRQICPECEELKAVKVIIPGKPFGKERPRFAGHAYTPRRTEVAERAIGWYYRTQAGNRVFRLPSITIVAVFEPPKSAKKATRAAMLAGEIRPTVKPDWDNIGKLVCDALNGIAFNDDKDIVEAAVIKKYGKQCQTEIYIREAVEKPKGDENK